MDFQFGTRVPPPPPAGRNITPDDLLSRIDYVDALLNMMLKKSLFVMHLTAGKPLPLPEAHATGSLEIPPYQAVVNRLKVMSRLNPIHYASPTSGKIEIPCKTHRLVYETCFDDKASPPACTITLKIRPA